MGEHRARPSFRGEAKLSTWIYSITRHALARRAAKERIYSTRFLHEHFRGDALPAPSEEAARPSAWKVEGEEKAFTAEARGCLLCAMGKRMGSAQPCRLYCINPMEGMIKGLDPSLALITRETLWDGERCLFEVRKE